MGACTSKMKDVDDPSSSQDDQTPVGSPDTTTDVEKPYTHSSRKIQKRPSQILRRVHFAENDDGEILEQIRYITPRNSMSYDKLGKIWEVLDKDEDGLLNFNELFHFASTVFLDVLESDVRDMLRKEDSEDELEGLDFTEWLHIVKNTDADIEVLVDDLYRVFCLGVEITDPDDVEEPKPKEPDNSPSHSMQITF